MSHRPLRLALGLGAFAGAVIFGLFLVRAVPELSPVGALNVFGPDSVHFMITNTGNTTMLSLEVVCSINKTVFLGGYTLATPHLEMKSPTPLGDVEPGASFLVDCIQLWNLGLDREGHTGFFALGQMTKKRPAAVIGFEIEGERLTPRERRVESEWIDVAQYRLIPRTDADVSVRVNYRSSLIPWRSARTFRLLGRAGDQTMEWKRGSDLETIPDGGPLKLTTYGLGIRQ